MKYFLHTLAVSFLAGALSYRSWLLGMCSVTILALITAKEAYSDYLSSKQNNETIKSVKQLEEALGKMERKFEQHQTELGKVSYRINQMGDYVGSPRD